MSISIRNSLYKICPSPLRSYWDRVEASTIGSRLARGVFWSMAGSVISRGLMLCATILVARILGKTVYGELGMIQSTIGMFGVFAGFGMGLTATKHIAEFRESDPEKAGRIMSLSGLFAILTGGIMALGVLVFAPWLAEQTINAPHLTGILRISALILFINALNGAQTGALSGFEAFKTIAHVNLFVGLISFPLLLSGAYFGGLSGAVWALAINLCFNWLLNHLALRNVSRRHSVPFKLMECKQEISILWKFSLPAVLASSMVGPVNWACNAMLVNRPHGYEEMGVYSAANQWYIVLMFLPRMLGSVVLPVLSEQLGKSNTKQSLETLYLSMKINLFIFIPLVLIASVASPYIMSLYGESFSNGWPTLIVVLMTAGLVAVSAPVGQIITASGRIWIGFIMNVGWAMIFILFTYLLLHFGSFGLATSRAIAYLFHTVWVILFVIWITKKQNTTT